MKKILKTKHICLFCLLIVYLATRMIGLLSIPIFLDEALHIEMGKIVMSGNPYVGARLGKCLSIQFYGFVLEVLGDSLFFARLIPVVLGLLTVSVLFALGQTGGGRKRTVPAVFGSLLYVLVPYSLFYDRLALTDQFLTVLLAFIFLFTFRLTEKPKLLDQVGLGAAILLSPLFKFNGLLFVPVPIIIILIIAERGERIRRLRDTSLSYSLSIPIILLFVLFATPDSEAGKLSSIRSVNALLQLATGNAKDTFTLFWSMLTPAPFLGLVIGGMTLAMLPVQRSSRCRIFAAAAVLIFLASPYVMLFKSWYPRYYLPLLVPLCLIGSEVSVFAMWSSGTSRRLVALSRALLFLVLTFAAANSVYLLCTPRTFPYFKGIRSQFITGWTSGYGLQDAVETIYRLSSNYPDGIRLLRPPRWDVPLLSLDVYFRELGPHTQRITLRSWKPDIIDSQLFEMLSDGKPTYLLFNSAYPYFDDQKMIRKILIGFGVRELAHFVKPDASPGLRLWRLDRKSDRIGYNTLKSN